MKKTISFVAGALVSLACSHSAFAAVIYETSFTTAQGAVDGALNSGGSGGPQFAGQGGFSISNAAGVGTLNSATGGFQRALFAFDNNAPVSNFKLTDLTGMTAGQSIVIDAFGAVLTQGSMQVGLANINDGNPLGGSNAALGYTVTSSTPGVAVGSPFNLSIVFKPGATSGNFDVLTSVDGVLRNTQSDIAPNLSNRSADLAGIIRDLNNANQAGFSLDGLKITTVPEPSVALLGGLGLLGLLRRRR